MSGKNNFCAWHGLFSSGLKYWLWMRYVSCRLEVNKSINLNLLGAQQATARYEVGHEYNHHGFDRNLALTMQLMSSLEKRSGSGTTSFSLNENDQLFLREFAESTILTIAHRLRTVIDYDRVSPNHN